MIRLLCVEDDPLVGTYLQPRLSLEPDIEVAGVVASAGDALVFVEFDGQRLGVGGHRSGWPMD